MICPIHSRSHHRSHSRPHHRSHSISGSFVPPSRVAFVRHPSSSNVGVVVVCSPVPPCTTPGCGRPRKPGRNSRGQFHKHCVDCFRRQNNSRSSSVPSVSFGGSVRIGGPFGGPVRLGGPFDGPVRLGGPFDGPVRLGSPFGGPVRLGSSFGVPVRIAGPFGFS